MAIATIGVGSGVRWGDIAGDLNSMLPEIYGMNKGLRPGSRVAMLSDSIGLGVYTGDATFGLNGSTLTSAGASALTFASSGGTFVRAVNASILGSTTTTMVSTVETHVIDHLSAPTSCIIWGGYNDAEIGVSLSTPIATILSTYKINIESIVEKLRVAGIVPILATPLPTANNAEIANILVQMAVYLKHFASKYGIPLVDFQTFSVDPTTGGLRTEIATGGDGVHPGTTGQKLLGGYLSDQLATILPPYKIPLMHSALDETNLAPNGLFAGAPVDGKAPDTFVYGSLPSGATPSVTTSTNVLGSMQRITCVATASDTRLAQRVQQGSPHSFDTGDTLLFSGIITASTINAAIYIAWGVAPSFWTPIKVASSTEYTEAHWGMELVVPSGIPNSYFDILLHVSSGTGFMEIGQLTVYNLTKLGLV